MLIVQINLNIMFPNDQVFKISSGCFDSSDDLRGNDPAHVLDVLQDEEEEAVGQEDQSQCSLQRGQRKDRFERN
jgi:hypothetical protein